MPEKVDGYDALEIEDNWIDYLRRRLPYSFLEIRAEQRRRGYRYILSKPTLHVGAEYHNFWRRGYPYYVAGKLMDTHNLSGLWIDYRRLLAERVLHGGHSIVVAAISTSHNYNAMQMEKLWSPVQENHLDRERVVMTNLCQAIELCLKAVRAHAEYRKHGVFRFDNDHDVKRIYESLPEALKQEMLTASRSFAKRYTAFRKAVEEDVKRLRYEWRGEGNWEVVGSRVESNTYTAILEANDPPTVPDGWFDGAMRLMHDYDITYHRYSPKEGRDDYPVEPIHSGLMLGRFLYEHLFPVHAGAPRRWITRFMAVNGWVLGQRPGTELPGRPVDAFFPCGWS